MISQKRIGLVITVILTAWLLYTQHRTLLKHPNDYIVGFGGDGTKNFFTAAYHIQNDKTYHYFEGMNYPYGEHVSFTDNQPIWSNSIKVLDNLGFNTAHYTKGILNVLLIFSVVLGAVFLYLIFIKLDVAAWYAVLATLGIIFLSPQHARFSVHCALSYVFVVPALLYLMLLYEEQKRVLISIIIALYVIFVAQIHFYYFILSVFFISFYSLYTIVATQNDRKRLVINFLIQIFVPFVFLFFYWIKIDNIATERPASPYGYAAYCAVWENIFLYAPTPWYAFIDKNITPIRQHSEYESYAIAGFVAFLFLISRMLLSLFRFKRNIFWKGHAYHLEYLRPMFFSGLMLFLLSLGLPFIIPGLEGLLEYTGPFKQFRSLGRFAWVFFYTINIAAFYVIYQQLKSDTYRILNILVAIVAFGILGFESYTFFHAQRNYELVTEAEVSERYKDNNQYLKKINWDEFQAILPAPFYHVGSENFNLDVLGNLLPNTCFPALYAGKPLMSVFMSRTDYVQSKKAVQLALEQVERPQILDDMPNQKPLLVMQDKFIYTETGGRNKNFVIYADTLYENDRIRFLSLPLNRLSMIYQYQRDTVTKEMSNKKLFPQAQFLSTNTSDNFVYKSFNDTQTETSYRGGGAFQGVFGQDNILFKGAVPNVTPYKEYKFSFWAYIPHDQYPALSVMIKEIDPNSGQQINLTDHNSALYLKAISKDWGLFELPLIFARNNSIIECKITKKALGNKKLFIDELLIRPSDTDIYEKSDKSVMKNLRWR